MARGRTRGRNFARAQSTAPVSCRGARVLFAAVGLPCDRWLAAGRVAEERWLPGRLRAMDLSFGSDRASRSFRPSPEGPERRRSVMSKTTAAPRRPGAGKSGASRRGGAAAKGKTTTTSTAGKRAATARTAAKARSTASKPAAAKRAAEPLKPGQLDGLVLGYLKKNARSAPLGPSGIAKGLERSSGAVANCLVRLARDERVVEVNERPRRYRLAA